MDQLQQPRDEERIETPADRASKEGVEEMSLDRWTDAELRQRAKDNGLEAGTLSRAKLIESLKSST